MIEKNYENEEYEFLSLYDLINKEIKRLNNKKYNSLAYFITDDKKSADFINSLLNDNAYTDYEMKDSMYKISQVRARHVAITYLMGLVFWPFIEKNLHLDNEQSIEYKSMWLKISLYHDRGYFSKYIKKDDLVYNKVWKYDLLSDVYDNILLRELNFFNNIHKEVCAYTNEEIRDYDAYVREYHKNSNRKSDERIDHGILGAVITFNELVKKFLKGIDEDTSLIDIKTICMTVAQHNIFKSPNDKYDDEYRKFNLNKLISTSDFRIGREYPYLYILSLVDTIECIKLFSKKDPLGDEGSFNALTVLKNISLCFGKMNKEILLDFSSLKKKCLEKDKNKKKKYMVEKYNKHKNSIKGLKSWTTFDVKVCKSNRNILSIICR